MILPSTQIFHKLQDLGGFSWQIKSTTTVINNKEVDNKHIITHRENPFPQAARRKFQRKTETCLWQPLIFHLCVEDSNVCQRQSMAKCTKGQNSHSDAPLAIWTCSIPWQNQMEQSGSHALFQKPMNHQYSISIVCAVMLCHLLFNPWKLKKSYSKWHIKVRSIHSGIILHEYIDFVFSVQFLLHKLNFYPPYL